MRKGEDEGEGEGERGRERGKEEGEEYPGTTATIHAPLVSTLLLWALRNCFLSSAWLRERSSCFCCKDLRASSAEARSFSN